jgi:pimeloyl-ACP methyl ester carboxylesterase
METMPTIVLVHGAFADASGFGPIITALEADGYSVVAPPNPLRGLAADAAGIHAAVSAIQGPVVLVGHSYGGAVISQASATLDNVTALVYFSAFALDVGESCYTVQGPFPPSMLGDNNTPTPYDAPDAAGGPDLYINKDTFHEVFCADSSAERAAILYATQRPLSYAALTETATAEGWSRIPSWFLVSEHDNAIPPAAEAFMAKRMKATTATVDGSHTAFIAHPDLATDLIRQAIKG